MTTARSAGRVRVLALLVIIAGAILAVAGVVTYAVVSSTLADQHITVSDDAAHFGGQQVTQPWQAYAQANVIAKHASEIAGGKTYAELPQDDPNRQTVMTASFLQASLFTSVVAFGVAAMAVGLGIVFILIGWALRALSHATPELAEPAPASVGAHRRTGDAEEPDTPRPPDPPEQPAPPAPDQPTG
jgi:ABC-type Fe3+-siderophore transport system permease subunit